MTNMHDIKARIKSIKETKQITNAMRLISASKLKKARRQLEATLPYFTKVKDTIADILIHSSNVNSIFFDLRHKKKAKKKGYLIISGDRGLAGSYNHNLLNFIEKVLDGDRNSLLFVAGQIGRAYLLEKGYNVDINFDYHVQDPTIFMAREIAEMLVKYFEDGILDEINLIYTMMKSSIQFEPQIIKLLPLDPHDLLKDSGIKVKNLDMDDLLIYEPSTDAVLEVLIVKYIKGFIYGAFVESFTSEQTARLSAMDNATTNADKMLHQLSLQYNRARQAAITQEISEIVGGITALK